MAESILALAANPPEDPAARRTLYKAAKRLMFSVESEHDLHHRLYYGGFSLYMANMAYDAGVFAALVAAGDEGQYPEEIAHTLGHEELLLARLLRGLAAYGLADIKPDGRYFANSKTKILAKPGMKHCVGHNVLTVLPSMQHLPRFLRQNGMKCPSNPNETAFQMAFDTNEDLFTYLGSHPEDLEAAVGHMAVRVDQASWLADDQLFPKQYFQLSEQELKDSRPLMVDIGGGSGHQCVAFRTQHPELTGRIILQDLPHTIAHVDKNKLASLDVKPMEHDFNTPQPIVGAKVYYLRNILHDWPNDVCLNILRQLRPALANDSVLIVDEIIVSEPEATWQSVNYDFIMMSVCGALERTKNQWEALFEKAGFQLKQIVEYNPDKGDGLLIATPA